MFCLIDPSVLLGLHSAGVGVGRASCWNHQSSAMPGPSHKKYQSWQGWITLGTVGKKRSYSLSLSGYMAFFFFQENSMDIPITQWVTSVNQLMVCVLICWAIEPAFNLCLKASREPWTHKRSEMPKLWRINSSLALTACGLFKENYRLKKQEYNSYSWKIPLDRKFHRWSTWLNYQKLLSNYV